MFRPAISLFVFLTAVTGGLYPGLVTAAAQALFPEEANGSIVYSGGVPVGSALIGQPFESARYFQGRPSATPGHPYDASASGGSNLGPSNPALAHAVSARIDRLRTEGETASPVPVDRVTASASGLDPDLSVEAVRSQVLRVAGARGLSPGRIDALVERHRRPRTFGLLGEERINVLALNLALDALRTE